MVSAAWEQGGSLTGAGMALQEYGQALAGGGEAVLLGLGPRSGGEYFLGGGQDPEMGR